MSITNFPSGVASYGVPVLGGGQITTTGKIVFVHSSGSAQSDGSSPSSPVSTLQRAVDLCRHDKGDYIVCMPRHAESILTANALTFNKRGVTVLGLGMGLMRPTLSFLGVVGASMLVNAQAVTIQNMLFLGGIDALTGPISITGADVSLLNIETRDVTGQATDFIVTAATADRMMIDGWVHRGAAAAGADTALSIVGGDGITVRNFWIDGNFAVAAIENVTTAATNLSIYGASGGPSYIRTRNAADVAITLVATTTGQVGPNIYVRLQDNAANGLASIVGAAAHFFLPIMIVNADNEVGAAYPGLASGV